MHIFTMILQVIVALGLLNVWLMRFNQTTSYRGGNARTLQEEFEAYSLPAWFYYLIGILKIGSAILLLLGLWIPQLVLPVSCIVSILMVGAIAMHVKIGDQWKKSLPAIIMLILSLGIVVGSTYSS